MKKVLLIVPFTLIIIGVSIYIYYRFHYLPEKIDKEETRRVKELDDKLYLKNPFVRMEAVESLIKGGKVKFISKVVEKLPLENEPTVRDFMIRKGRDVKDEGSLLYLKDFLKEGKDARQRLFAFNALISSPLHRAEAIALFSRDRDPKIRCYSAVACGRYPDISRDILFELIKDPDFCVRAWAYHSLVKIQGDASLPVLKDTLRSEKGHEERGGRMKEIIRSIICSFSKEGRSDLLPFSDEDKEKIERSLSIPSPEDIPFQFVRQRLEPERSSILKKAGMDPEVILNAVDLSLKWLQIHQEDDGSYQLGKHNPHYPREIPEGYYAEDDFFSVAATGLALELFAVTGNTHKYGIYRETVERALNYILSHQDKWGMFATMVRETKVSHEEFLAEPHPRIHRLTPDRSIEKVGEPEPYPYANITLRYNHSVPLLGLIELYLMTGDSSLVSPIERGLNYLSRVQLPRLGFSFFYEPTDICPAFYAIPAVILAEKAGLNFPKRLLTEAKKYIDFMTDEAKGTIEPHCAAGFGSTATGMVIRSFILGKDDPILPKMAAFFLPHPPQWFPNQWIPLVGENAPEDRDNILDLKYIQTSNLALFLADHPAFTEWYGKSCRFFLENMKTEGDAAGTWEPEGLWSVYSGRFYSTYCGVLTLLTPVRYRF